MLLAGLGNSLTSTRSTSCIAAEGLFCRLMLSIYIALPHPVTFSNLKLTWFCPERLTTGTETVFHCDAVGVNRVVCSGAVARSAPFWFHTFVQVLPQLRL